jgi:DNA repair exonuclease SbcCD ATPase subunit
MSRNALKPVPSPQSVSPQTLLIDTRQPQRPNVDALVDQLLKRDETVDSTVEDILNHPQVKKHGMLGRLSSSQQHLVTSVVSIMQDRISADARKNAQALRQLILAEREALQNVSRSFAETARHLYQLPLLGLGRDDGPPQQPGAPAEAAYTPPPQKPLLFRLLTWGNLLAFTAIGMAVFAIKTSIETADFEARYRVTQSSLDELKVAHAKLETELDDTRDEGQKIIRQNTTLQTQLAESTTQAQADRERLQADKERLQLDLDRHTQQIASLEEDIARQRALLSQSEISSAKAREKLLDDISALKEKLASSKGRESRTDQNSQAWKDLANERKAEIEKLRALLSESRGDNGQSGFLGLF